MKSLINSIYGPRQQTQNYKIFWQFSSLSQVHCSMQRKGRSHLFIHDSLNIQQSCSVINWINGSYKKSFSRTLLELKNEKIFINIFLLLYNNNKVLRPEVEIYNNVMDSNDKRDLLDGSNNDEIFFLTYFFVGSRKSLAVTLKLVQCFDIGIYCLEIILNIFISSSRCWELLFFNTR